MWLKDERRKKGQRDGGRCWLGRLASSDLDHRRRIPHVRPRLWSDARWRQRHDPLAHACTAARPHARMAYDNSSRVFVVVVPLFVLSGVWRIALAAVAVVGRHLTATAHRQRQTESTNPTPHREKARRSDTDDVTRTDRYIDQRTIRVG